MKQSFFTVKSNVQLTRDVYRISLIGDTSEITAPGTFVNIRLDGLFLRRPLSVYDVEGDILTLIYKCVGTGTEMLSRKIPGDKLDVLTGLGNGYDVSAAGTNPVLVGGGVGVPPLYYLAKCLLKNNIKPSVIIGFNKTEEIFALDEFKKLGIDVTVTTVDGSTGVRGFVTDALPENYSYVYTCGPEPMLKAVYSKINTDGQFSFEERMGCGFGACMGCSCKTVTGFKRICKDGPVLKKGEIIWQT